MLTGPVGFHGGNDLPPPSVSDRATSRILCGYCLTSRRDIGVGPTRIDYATGSALALREFSRSTTRSSRRYRSRSDSYCRRMEDAVWRM